MLPKKRNNIYPLIEQNITAILNYYFDIPHGNIDWLYEQKELTTNQIEWIAKSISDNVSLLRNEMASNEFTVTVLMLMGRDAFYRDNKNWIGNKDHKAVTEKLRGLVLKADS